MASKLGTVWVAPGEGSTWRELADKLNYRGGWPSVNFNRAHTLRLHSKPGESMWETKYERTNLLLTGNLIGSYDVQRWESGNVHS